MHKKLVNVSTFSLSLLLADSLYADDNIDPAEARMTLTGNTVEGKFVKQDTRYKMYFHPSGNLALIDSKGEIAKGSWNINSNGEVY